MDAFWGGFFSEYEGKANLLSLCNLFKDICSTRMHTLTPSYSSFYLSFSIVLSCNIFSGLTQARCAQTRWESQFSTVLYSSHGCHLLFHRHHSHQRRISWLVDVKGVGVGVGSLSRSFSAGHVLTCGHPVLVNEFAVSKSQHSIEPPASLAPRVVSFRFPLRFYSVQSNIYL